jgi:SNF2 family DNA or RNA helicase
MTQIKLIANGYKYPVEMYQEGDRYFFKFGYNKSILAIVKQMQGAKWHGFDDKPRKLWSIPITPRNLFQLSFMMGQNPYAIFDKPFIEVKTTRNLYEHQLEMIRHALTRRMCIFACEMGTGKTLAAIEVMEKSGYNDWWWVGPKSALAAVMLEFSKWKSKVYPKMFTYNGLKSTLENYTGPAPHGVVFDESSKIKTPSAQRSQYAMHLANSIRREYAGAGYIILMSGTPAPKAPTDWWNQTEVCCPGFFKEGDIQKFRSSLAVIEEMESLTGGVFPKLVGWYDDEKKCKKCLQLREHENHDTIFGRNPHEFVSSVNEVHRLYTRMRGLVLVKFKKDCLDLPEKQYRKIYCPASKELERAAQFIKNTASRAVQALTLLRELSDGFQYVDTVVGMETCKVCGGKKLICDGCNGKGEVKKYRQETQEVTSPKDAILRDLLDEHEDVGRIVIYAGFTGSVEKCIKICRSMGWEVLRLDGRGWYTTIESDSAEELLKAFDLTHPEFKHYLAKIPKLAFIGQPGAGGMGLTLTASPSVVYFSNDFNGTNRMQSEDRIHRPGMDTNKGATIIDIINLPTDELVLANLQKKKDLQNLTMGEVMEALENANSKRITQ